MAEELRGRGLEVVVPSLVEAARAGEWARCVDVVVRSAPAGEVVLVGHSGAGPLLPAIAARIEPPPGRLVFVDASVPPSGGDVALAPEAFLPSLPWLAREGLLPRWSEWFGPGAMDALVPDPERRGTVVDELVELPVSYFAGRVPLPTGWDVGNAAFVLLSDPYRDDAREAALRGWAIHELPYGHLGIVNRPEVIADVLVELAQEL
ncbi:MAG: alpha/beta hydrolase [Acidimicrobiales bacterium]